MWVSQLPFSSVKQFLSVAEEKDRVLSLAVFKFIFLGRHWVQLYDVESNHPSKHTNKLYSATVQSCFIFHRQDRKRPEAKDLVREERQTVMEQRDAF